MVIEGKTSNEKAYLPKGYLNKGDIRGNNRDLPAGKPDHKNVCTPVKKFHWIFGQLSSNWIIQNINPFKFSFLEEGFHIFNDILMIQVYYMVNSQGLEILYLFSSPER